MPLTLGCFILIFLVPWDIKLGCFRFFLFLEVWTLSLWTSLLELLLLHPISFSMLNFHFHIWKYFFYLLEWATVSLWSEVAQSCPTLCNPVDCSLPGSSIHGMGFSRQEYWSGLPFPSPRDLPDLGIEPRSPTLQADALTCVPPSTFLCLLLNKSRFIWCDYSYSSFILVFIAWNFFFHPFTFTRTLLEVSLHLRWPSYWQRVDESYFLIHLATLSFDWSG